MENTIDDKIFEDVKNAAISVWSEYDDQFGYASEKIQRVNNITNIGDNIYFIIAMFDSSNQRKMYNRLKLEETKQTIKQYMY